MTAENRDQSSSMRSPQSFSGCDRFPDLAVEHTIGERFFDIAALYPERDAISSRSATWTYNELADTVRRMAGGITASLGETQGHVIAIVCNHDGPLVAAMMAVICAGHIALVVDPTTTLHSNTLLLNEAGPSLILTDSPNQELTILLAHSIGCPALQLDELEGFFTPNHLLGGKSPVMLSFTSGTSDVPKGALINHGVVLNAIRGASNTLRLQPNDRLPLLFPLSLTLAAFPVFGALLNGGCVAVLDIRAEGISPIADFFDSERITLAFLAPTVARLLLGCLGEQSFSSIRMVMLAGEPVDADILARTCEAFTCEEMAVAYGITETGLLTLAVYPRDALPEFDVSCGYPIPDVDLVVVDDNGHPVETGQTGEIIVVSDHLFDGYVGHPELDDLVLGPDPSGRTSRSSYRTGDLGRLDSRGSLTLEGRNGSIVNVRGRLVALGEVESDLRALDGVLDAAVIAVSAHGVDELVAYIVPTHLEAFEPRHWRSSLLMIRDSYRVPTQWVRLEEIPLLPNGKVNRRALPSTGTTRIVDGRALSLSSRDGANLRNTLRALWCEILPNAPIRDDEDFFQLGGDSLLAAQMLIMLEHRTGVAIPMGELLHARTIDDLATLLYRAHIASDYTPSVVTCVQHGDESIMPRLWFVHDLQGSAFRIRHLAAALNDEQPLWSFESPLLMGHRNTFTTMESFAASYITAMKEFQPTGPYWLAGYSFGGICVYEMARQLATAGEEVSFLGVIDIGPGFRGRGWNSRRSPLRPWYGIAQPPPEGSTIRDSLIHYTTMAANTPSRFFRHAMVRSGLSRVIDPVRFERDLKHHGTIRPEWRLWYAWEQHWQLAARRWNRQGGYTGCLDLLWASETAAADATMGWAPMVADLRIHRFRGDHFGVLEERGAESLASALSKAIQIALS